MKPWRSTFLTNSVIFAASLVGGVLAARFLGTEDRGLLAAVTYWPHFVAGVAAMGLNEGIVIRTANSGTTHTLRATTFAISLGLALPLGVIGYYLIPMFLSESRQDYLLFSQFYFLVFLPFSFLAMNFLAVDQGELNFHQFNLQRIIQATVYPLLLLGLWLVGLLTVESAAIAVLSGTVIIALLRLWNARSGLAKRPSLIEARQLFVISFRLHMANMVTFLAMQIDTMALVLFSSNTQLGLYVVAFTAAGAVQSLFVTTYINIMLPTAAKIGSRKEHVEEILVPLRKLLGIIVLCSVLLILFMPYLIFLVFGNEFMTAASYAQILVLAFLFVGIKKVLVYLIRSWQLNRPAIFGDGFTAFILIFGSYLAIHWWGTIGLCILVLLAHAMGAILLIYYFLKITRLNLRKFVQLGPIFAR